MEKENLTTFKSRLENLRAEIISLIQDEDAPALGREALDEIDQASNALARQMGSLMSSNHRKNLEKVDAALKRIQWETYGKCSECGADIPLKRLEILPFTGLCVDCRTELENSG